MIAFFCQKLCKLATVGHLYNAESKNYQPRSIYLIKISFQEKKKSKNKYSLGQRKGNNNWLPGRLALEVMLKGVRQVEGDGNLDLHQGIKSTRNVKL